MCKDPVKSFLEAGLKDYLKIRRAFFAFYTLLSAIHTQFYAFHTNPIECWLNVR